MITITIPARPSMEMWDPKLEEFVQTEPIRETKITLEHSLLSISKWESKWKKAFLKKEQKTAEEVLDYIRCMTIEKNIPENVYDNILPKDIERITDYIQDPMTATHVQQKPEYGKPNAKQDVVTSELIYYWMVANQIPFECERWHINRLLALIQICSAKNAQMYGGKRKGKGNKSAMLKHNAALNAARRAQTGSLG